MEIKHTELLKFRNETNSECPSWKRILKSKEPSTRQRPAHIIHIRQLLRVGGKALSKAGRKRVRKGTK